MPAYNYSVTVIASAGCHNRPDRIRYPYTNLLRYMDLLRYTDLLLTSSEPQSEAARHHYNCTYRTYRCWRGQKYIMEGTVHFTRHTQLLTKGEGGGGGEGGVGWGGVGKGERDTQLSLPIRRAAQSSAGDAAARWHSTCSAQWTGTMYINKGRLPPNLVLLNHHLPLHLLGALVLGFWRRRRRKNKKKEEKKNKKKEEKKTRRRRNKKKKKKKKKKKRKKQEEDPPPPPPPKKRKNKKEEEKKEKTRRKKEQRANKTKKIINKLFVSV